MTQARGAGPLLAGLAGRCPHCGKGRLFSGFLSLVVACEVCGFDLAKADSGDGPAVFVILIVGFIAVFGAMFTAIAYNPPVWVPLIIWIPVAAVLSLALLRPMKGLMIAAHIRNRAGTHGP